MRASLVARKITWVFIFYLSTCTQRALEYVDICIFFNEALAQELHFCLRKMMYPKLQAQKKKTSKG